MSIFGGGALDIVVNAVNHELAENIVNNVSLAIFIYFDHLPLSTILSFIGFILVAIYYVTVADTSTFVLGMLSEGGTLNPSTKIKMIWGIIQSGVAAVLLLSGGLEVLQTASIVAALPFAFIMVLMCYSLLKGLISELAIQKRKSK